MRGLLHELATICTASDYAAAVAHRLSTQLVPMDGQCDEWRVWR